MRLHGRFGLGRAARDQPCHRLDVTALALALSGHCRARRFDCRAGLVEALLEKQAHAGTGVGHGGPSRKPTWPPSATNSTSISGGSVFGSGSEPAGTNGSSSALMSSVGRRTWARYGFELARAQ